MEPYIKRKIRKKEDKAFEEREDFVAVEKRLRVSLNRKEVISLYCTPLMIEELIIGLFFTEGILKKIPSEGMSIKYGEDITVNIPVTKDILTEKNRTARCLGGITFNRKRKFKRIKSDFSIKIEVFKAIISEFQKKSELFRLTGCFHGAAISDSGKLIIFAEDIGRHNAVDKVIGYCLLKGIPFTEKIMLVSCRLSSEIISKCSRWGIPILASRAAPTDLAIAIAEQSGITLIGFMRGDSMNIYTNPQRLKLSYKNPKQI